MISMISTLQKWGNSHGIRLPKNILEAASFAEDEEVEILADQNGIRIRKAKHPETLRDLFKDYHGDYKGEEWDTGKPMGDEVW